MALGRIDLIVTKILQKISTAPLFILNDGISLWIIEELARCRRK